MDFRPKIKYLLFPLKRPKIFLMIWKLLLLFFSHQNSYRYLLIRGLSLLLLLFFHTILLQNSKLNSVLGGNDIFRIFGILYPSSRMKKKNFFLTTDSSVFNTVV